MTKEPFYWEEEVELTDPQAKIGVAFLGYSAADEQIPIEAYDETPPGQLSLFDVLPDGSFGNYYTDRVE